MDINFQVTRGLLEILVQLVQGETRVRMGYLDLLEKKEPWEVDVLTFRKMKLIRQ